MACRGAQQALHVRDVLCSGLAAQLITTMFPYEIEFYPSGLQSPDFLLSTLWP